MERYSRPVFVLSIEDGFASGSGRSVTGVMLLDALDAMSELFTQYGGHSHAAGLKMHAHHVDEFRERFSGYVGERLPPEDRCPRLHIDAVVEIPDVTNGLFDALQMLEPYGNGNPEPLLALRECQVANFALMKEKHVKLAVRKDNRVLFLKGFNLAERAAEMPVGARVDVAFTLGADTFSGGWSATLKDVRRA